MGYANVEDLVAYQRAYRAAHRAAAQKATRDWRAANGERRRRVDAAWREGARERIREQHRAWMKANPDRVRDNTARQRAKRKPVLVVGKVSRALVWQRDEGICGICRLPASPMGWHLDHIVPIARGGAHSMDNVQVSHPACNRRKGTK